MASGQIDLSVESAYQNIHPTDPCMRKLNLGIMQPYSTVQSLRIVNAVYFIPHFSRQEKAVNAPYHHSIGANFKDFLPI